MHDAIQILGLIAICAVMYVGGYTAGRKRIPESKKVVSVWGGAASYDVEFLRVLHKNESCEPHPQGGVTLHREGQAPLRVWVEGGAYREKFIDVRSTQIVRALASD